MSAVIGLCVGLVFFLRWSERNGERAWLVFCFLLLLWWLKP